MNPQKITDLLGIPAANAPHRTPDCPDDHEFASYVTGQLSAEARDQFQGHMADCDFCIRQVGLLSRLHETEPGQQVAEFVLARAARLANTRKPAVYRYVPRWAATAAVIVLAFALTFSWSPLNSPEPDATGTEYSSPAPNNPQQSRNIEATDRAPRLISPVEGANIEADKLLIRWAETPGSLYYDVRVVSDEGNLVWQERVEGTESGLPENLRLEPGTDYYVRVDAYVAAAKSISSRHVLFTVREQR